MVEECINGVDAKPDPQKHFIMKLDQLKINKIMQNKENAREDEIFKYLKMIPDYEQKNQLEMNLIGDCPRLRIKFDVTSEGAVERLEHMLKPDSSQHETVFLVGRSDNAHIKIQGSSISRKQARIIYNYQYGWLLDDGDERKSTNGTFVWLNKS